jgi:hypothetical protein
MDCGAREKGDPCHAALQDSPQCTGVLKGRYGSIDRKDLDRAAGLSDSPGKYFTSFLGPGQEKAPTTHRLQKIG